MSNNKRTRRRLRRPSVESLESRTLLAAVVGGTVAEDGQTASFTIQLEAPATEPVRFAFSTSEESARAGIDYQPIRSHEVLFDIGESSKVVPVQLIDNTIRDGDRSFRGAVIEIDENGDPLPRHSLRLSEFESSRDATFETTNEHLVYQTYNEGEVNFYSARLDGTTPAVKLNSRHSSPSSSRPTKFFQVTPDGGHVLYTSDEETNDFTRHLYSVPIDGSEPAVRLNGPLDREIREQFRPRVSPDGSRVIFQYQDASSTYYSAKIDGTGDPVILGGGPDLFGISPDSQLVVMHSTRSNGSDRLTVQPIDGSSDPVELDIPKHMHLLHQGTRIAIGSSGSRIIFVGREFNSRPGDLYSVPLDGSEPATLLASDVDTARFAISSTSRSVIYQTNYLSSETSELFSVPIDGSSQPKRLYSPGQADVEVAGFELINHGRTVLFSSFLPTSSGIALFTAPADGTKPPTKLGDATSIAKFTAAYASEQVVFEGIHDDSSWSLFSVREGSDDQVQISEAGNDSYFGTVSWSTSLDFRTFVQRTRDAGDTEYWEYAVDGSLPPTLIRTDDAYSFQRTNEATVFISRSATQSNLVTVVQGVSDGSINITDDDLDVADFGDAPTGYPVLMSDDGARHTVGTLFLGASVNAEADGQSSDGAVVDDQTESGINLLTDMVASDQEAIATIEITVSAAGKLDGWIDFNHDQFWDEHADRVLSSIDVVAGKNLISLIVPAGAKPGETFGRFRLSSSGGLGATGSAADGEVEDHVFSILGSDDQTNEVSVSWIDSATQIELEDERWVVRGSDRELFAAPPSAFDELVLVAGDTDDTLEIVGDIGNAARVRFDGAGGKNVLRFNNPSTDAETRVSLNLSQSGNIAVANVDVVDARSTGAVQVILDGSAIENNTVVLADDTAEFVFTDSSDWRINDVSIVDGRFHRTVVNSITGLNAMFDAPHVWHNFVNRFDVDNNGRVSPLDALLVINRYADAIDSNSLAAPTGTDDWIGHYYDVSPNDRITPLDALLVINQIALRPALPVANGEFVKALVATNSLSFPVSSTIGGLDRLAAGEPSITEPIAQSVSRQGAVESSNIETSKAFLDLPAESSVAKDTDESSSNRTIDDLAIRALLTV